MNENAGKGKIKSVAGIDCVIAWLEPICKDDPYRNARRDKERKAWSRAAVMNGVYKDSVFEFGTASLRLGLSTMFAHKI